MKKLVIALILCAAFAPQGAFAAQRHGVNLEIISQEAINDKCQDGELEINGCYFSKASEIYLSDDLSKYAFRRVVMHELGHYLLNDAPMKIFRGFKKYDGIRNPARERAAERFADYILSADTEERITKDERNLFDEALTGKYIRK
jgi:Zn-dependent peptidase ImmA (M78 family)